MPAWCSDGLVLKHLVANDRCNSEELCTLVSHRWFAFEPVLDGLDLLGWEKPRKGVFVDSVQIADAHEPLLLMRGHPPGSPVEELPKEDDGLRFAGNRLFCE